MKRFRLFAGPNGSGKSTLIKEIAKKYYIGYFINADEIERILRLNSFIDCSEYIPITVVQEDWDSFADVIKVKDTRAKETSLSLIKIKENVLYNEGSIDSYNAALIAEFFRTKLLYSNVSFSFETVMSHPSKIDFLKEANNKGFKTYMYFICTQDPLININRVQMRVNQGGHHVDANKIVERYYRSIELLCDAFLSVDRGFIIDSSSEDGITIFVEKNADEITVLSDEIPEWIETYLLKNIV